MIDPEKSVGEKLGALPKIAAFYAWWYPTRWLGWGLWPRYAEFGRAGDAPALRRAQRPAGCRAQIFHGMIVHQGKLQNKQGFLFRLVDIANELFAMAASVSRAHAMAEAGHPEAANAAELADLFCRNSRRWSCRCSTSCGPTTTSASTRWRCEVLDGKHAWLEEGILGLEDRGVSSLEMKPEAVGGGKPEPVPVPKVRPVGTH